MTLELSEGAAAELAEYALWVEECSGATASEARFKTVDFAVREIFRRDRVWQAKRRKAPQPEEAKAAAAVTPGPVARPPGAAPPSPPPPTPRDPGVTGARDVNGTRI